MIFTLIRARTIPQVPIEMFLVTGFVPFFMFRNIVTQIMAGVQANRALIAYKPVKPIHIFIARTLLEMCIYFAVFVLFMAGFGWFLDLPILPVHFLEVFVAYSTSLFKNAKQTPKANPKNAKPKNATNKAFASKKARNKK